MLDSRAITKIQSISLIAVIVVAAASVAAAYFLLGGEKESLETIKIGVCADIDVGGGKSTLQGAILAAEQVNAEGGVLGRNFTVVSQDDDSLSWGSEDNAHNAMTKLITVDEADFIVSSGVVAFVGVYQEVVAQYQKILFYFGGSNADAWTQKVLDNYDRYKYYFYGIQNETALELINNRTYSDMKELLGLNKVAIWVSGTPTQGGLVEDDTRVLNELGFEVVHSAYIPSDTMDFSSYFAEAEAAGAEIIIPWIFSAGGGPLLNEWYDRQSPTVLWNLPYFANPNTWEWTGGKCNYITSSVAAVCAGYPLTSKVMPTREAYFERWGEELTGAFIAFAYDIVRFILPDAIERAGTIETDAVIEALEEIEMETSLYENFAFSSSHAPLIREYENYMGTVLFQWQNGEQVPVWPNEVREEANATYMYPDWPGPWDEQ